MSEKTLKCGCKINLEEIKKLPVIECPNCHQKIHKTNYCTCCGTDLRDIND
jgi:DNA-directed RNA polymerase subunit RPC12/RpoP